MYVRKTKTCKRCGKRKPNAQFAAWPNGGFDIRHLCPSCLGCRRESRIRITRRRNKQNNGANWKVREAIRKGLVVKQDCCVCAKHGKPFGFNAYIHNQIAHHSDYRKPLDVMWLCWQHHMAWHKVFKTEDKPD